MSDLLDILNRRKRAREFTEGFREDATPEELKYYDRFYQEPSASPIMQRGALEGELDSADALRRQLMARGMNALQADDATKRALAQEESNLQRDAESIATQYGPGGLKGTGEGSFESYQQGLKPDPSSVGWGIHPDDRDVSGLSLEDWSRQRAMARRDAPGVSAESKAQYDEQTVDDRIDIIEQQAAALPAELEAKKVSNEVTTKLMTEIGRLVDLARQDPSNADTYIQRAQNLHGIVKSRSGSTGFSSYTADQFINDAVDQSKAQDVAQGGAAGARQDGQNFLIPTTEKVVGDYER
jgi:hypothetical protein